MKFNSILVSLVALAAFFFSCEDQIYPNLQDAEPILVVDAWITNRPEPQKIKITRTQPYFENLLPPGVSGAAVSVKDSEGKIYTFIEDNDETGTYVWTPVGNEVFGEVGLEYALNIISSEGETFQASTSMGRVPVVDSITFTFEPGDQFVDDQYLAEFWATDPAGVGDIYWIKTYKNGTLLNRPSEINLAYDASFSRNDDSQEAIIFIQPIRTDVNPFDENSDGTFKSPYLVGDSLYVEINSISEAAFDFLNEVIVQTDRPGGFAELFTSPLANVSSNVSNTNAAGSKVVGFFNIASVSGLGRKFNSLDDLSKD